MKLATTTDFVLEKQMTDETVMNRFLKITNYDKFLKQPLELWMFIACDEDGNVLEEPLHIELYEGDAYDLDHEKYQQAKERCLFEGFKVQNTKYWIDFYGGIRVYIPSKDLGNMVSVVFRESEPINKTIEYLVKYNLQLTQTAIKQLGL